MRGSAAHFFRHPRGRYFDLNYSRVRRIPFGAVYELPRQYIKDDQLTRPMVGAIHKLPVNRLWALMGILHELPLLAAWRGVVPKHWQHPR